MLVHYNRIFTTILGILFWLSYWLSIITKKDVATFRLIVNVL